MRRLIEFLVGYGNLFFFLALQGLAFVLLFRFSERHEAVYAGAASTVSGQVQAWNADLRGYFGLAAANDALMHENMALRQELGQLKRQLGALGHRVPYAPDFTILPDSAQPYQRFRFQTARAVSQTTYTDYNYLVLDRGRHDGVVRDMGVMSATGAAGMVVAVSEHYALAMSVLNKDFRLSVRLKRPEIYGTLQWAGGSTRTANILYVPQHFQIVPGDTVVTSGYGTIFPEGIRVGTVESVTPNEQGGFHDIRVRLSTDFHRLDYVYLLRHEQKAEMDSLAQSAGLKINPVQQP